MEKLGHGHVTLLDKGQRCRLATFTIAHGTKNRKQGGFLLVDAVLVQLCPTHTNLNSKSWYIRATLARVL